MCFATPSVPSAPPPIPMAVEQDRAVTASIDAERKRRAQASGLASTMLTGPLGAAPPTGAGKTLLGG